jgi:hypothetical protein
MNKIAFARNQDSPTCALQRICSAAPLAFKNVSNNCAIVCDDGSGRTENPILCNDLAIFLPAILWSSECSPLLRNVGLDNKLGGDTVLFYGGPDQIIPIASALSTIFGVVMIFWGKLLNLLRKIGVFAPSTTQSQDKPEA